MRNAPIDSHALVLIDVQHNMLMGRDAVPDAGSIGAAITEIVNRARDAGVAIIHVRNNGGPDDPDAPGTVGWQLVHHVLDGEHVIDKYEMNAFAGTELSSLLAGVRGITVVGMQSEYCVRATSRAALQRGFAVTLVRGAHATYGESARELSATVERDLENEGARVIELDAFTFS